MRKKYLSALLFGALLVTSAGTFTSCKDYDDDINNLQEQITANADAIKKLQEMIGDGKFVTGVTAENNGLKITWNDGQSTVIENVINGEAQQGDVVTINAETGEIVINGEGTGFFATKGEGEIKLPYVNDEGVLVLVDAEGKEVVTGIRVAPVTAVVNEDGSAVLTIIAADGTKQTVNIPSAASSITDLVVSGEVNGIITLGFNHYVFALADNADLRKSWNGGKTLPAEGTNIVRTVEPNNFGLRINPISIDASGIDFTLVNSANNVLPGIKVVASANDTPLAGADTRAASKGGVYDLTVEDLLLDKNTYMPAWSSCLKNQVNENINFALTANGGVRSAYNIQGNYSNNQTASLDKIYLWYNNSLNDENTGASSIAVTLDKNVTYPIEVDNAEALYDMMISADAEAISNYGLVIDKENYTIKITKDADVSTEGKFTFTVKTVTVNGTVKEYTYNVTLSNKINNPAEYAEISHPIKTQAEQNFFAIDLATMKEAMSAEELNTWKTRIDLGRTEYSFYNMNPDGSVGSEISNLFTETSTERLFTTLVSDKNTYDAKPATEKDKANYVVVKVDNNKANSSTLKLFTSYYVAVTFNTSDGDEVNTIYVPVKFTAPTVAEQYEVKSGLFKDGVVYGFFNTQRQGTACATYTIVEAFSKYADGANYSATTDLIEGTQIESNGNNGVDVTSNGGNGTTVAFKQAIPAGVNKVQDAYDKAFTIKATKDDYAGWPYVNDAQKNYTFKMKLLSPIFSGTFAANGTIEVNGGQAYTITNAQLNVKDFNNTPVNILHDAIKEGTGTAPTATWSDKRVWDVQAVGVTGQLKDAAVVAGKVDADGKLTEGTISGRANSVATDADSKITITVKDIFGYVKSFELPVTVKANR